MVDKFLIIISSASIVTLLIIMVKSEGSLHRSYWVFIDGLSSGINLIKARSWASQRTGLLNHRHLPLDEGLYLPKSYSVHTMYMNFAIDIIFLDRNHKILQIAADVPPNTSKISGPRGTRAIIELSAGAAALHNLTENQCLELRLCT